MARKPITVKVEGLDRLAAKLDRLPAGMLRGAESAVAATTDAVRDLMRDAAPVDTGELRDSIQAEHSGLSGTVAATAGHADDVEFGTSKMAEQPFATPAAEQGRAILVEQVREHVRGELPT